MNRYQHSKIFNAYLSRLNLTQLNSLTQAINNCWHAALNSNTNAQISAANTQQEQVTTILDQWSEDDVKNINTIIQREFDQEKNIMLEEIDRQINELEQEQIRVKQWINDLGFDCTSAPWIIARRYRKELKDHLMNLKLNRELVNENSKRNSRHT